MTVVNGSGIAAAVPVGTIKPYGGSSAPSGWLECDGAAVSRTTYADLFTVIGTTYGVGDGSTTFNVPDLRGRSILGEGTGSGLTNRSRGDTDGEETHSVTTAELSSHRHPPNGDVGFITYTEEDLKPVDDLTSNKDVNKTKNTTTANSGSGTGHNTMHPFGVAKYLIKT